MDEGEHLGGEELSCYTSCQFALPINHEINDLPLANFIASTAGIRTSGRHSLFPRENSVLGPFNADGRYRYGNHLARL